MSRLKIQYIQHRGTVYIPVLFFVIKGSFNLFTFETDNS